MDQILFSLAEAAGILGIASDTLRELVNDGAIQFVQLRANRGDYRFRRCDLEGFVGGLPARRKGEPERLPNAVTNGQRRSHQQAPSSKREPITPIRQSAIQERNP